MLATASGTIAGVAFIDSNANGIHDSSETAVQGIPIKLVGTTAEGLAATAQVTTDANGAYTFVNVLPGTYQLQVGPSQGVVGGNTDAAAGASVISGITIKGSETVTQDIAFLGLAPDQISLRLFRTNSTSADLPFAVAGTGQGTVNSRANNAPLVATAVQVGVKSTLSLTFARLSTGDTITRSDGGSWLADGFTAGQTIAISDGTVTTNNGTYTLTAVTATTLTVSAFNTVTAGTFTKTIAPGVIDLAGFFSDPDITNSLIRLDTTAGPINVQLFDTTAPRTVANFFNYILSHRYDATIFHRLASNFVLQGGGFTFVPSPASLVPVSADPAVKNEFGASNLVGTLAMAKMPNDPNSATSEFFFNLANNSSNLDNQNGGFTVFAKLVGPADQAVVTTLTGTPVQNHGSPFDNIPLNGYSGSNFPSDTVAANYIMVNDVAVVQRNEFLTYTAQSSNPALVTAAINNNRLTLNYVAGATGSAVITVRATDIFGASAVTTFNVTAA